MWTKAIDPQPDRVPAENQTALGQQVFDVGRAHGEAMVSPNSVCVDFAREPEALQVQHTRWHFHYVVITCSCKLNNLAIPINGFCNPRRRHSPLGWKSPVAFERKVA
jgi:hypothetical protein